jgi:PhzF family phenazine biosynthesis protein
MVQKYILTRGVSFMPVPLYIVDAFADAPFSGNPAAVCILDTARDADWMQQVACEMNMAETAFVLPQGDTWSLRWFTPVVEVDLCGHATLAAAHILWETGMLAVQHTASFSTRSGLLTAVRTEMDIELDFPATPPEPVVEPEELRTALGCKPLYCGKSRFDYIVEVDSAETVRTLQPDLTVLKMIPARGIIVTSLSDTEEFDFVSRFFAPAAGIDEDPVTGSAHCCLGPYWMERLNKQEFNAYQASPRGGKLRVQVAGDRVYLGGHAVTVVRGELIND